MFQEVGPHIHELLIDRHGRLLLVFLGIKSSAFLKVDHAFSRDFEVQIILGRFFLGKQNSLGQRSQKLWALRNLGPLN